MEWISVDIGLPNNKVAVKFKTADGEEVTGCRINRLWHKYLDEHSMLLLDKPATHWMPLPPAPAEEAEA